MPILFSDGIGFFLENGSFKIECKFIKFVCFSFSKTLNLKHKTNN